MKAGMEAAGFVFKWGIGWFVPNKRIKPYKPVNPRPTPRFYTAAELIRMPTIKR